MTTKLEWNEKPGQLESTGAGTVKPASGGLKYDGDKPPLELLDRYALEETARVLGFGAKKYAKHNWRKGIAQSRLIGAALRHLQAFNDGEDVDPETGISHVAHAMCCCMFSLRTQRDRPELDDRHTKESN